LHATVGAHYRHPPADVFAAIEEAARQTEGVLPSPAVDVRTEEFGDFAVGYDVKYWIRDYVDSEEIAKSFMTHVWYAFDRHGIEIPFPIRQVYAHEVTAETEAERERDLEERIVRHLRGTELFESLDEEETRTLAKRARLERFFTGEVLMRQGDPGDSMHILDRGRVAVEVTRDGRSRRLTELEPRAFIGEMALMTGAERTATVIALEPTRSVVVDHEAFCGILERNPSVAERISETLARRRDELEATSAELREAALGATQEDRHQILSRIRDFFGFGGSE
ncbi:MAG: mechanosensitive ion channel family protein, partial [Gemmatimonadota bacterium]|nr:mechanosensitive ion channel family protein [Gemmatimonadota bacterium]